MNAILHEQFKRVESALNNLIDSISAYNPSPTAADALIEADDELTRGLEQLTTHQSNHATLVRLRSTSAALSDQTTQILSQLANTRTEVLSTPATNFPKDGRDVPYEELLTYAKKISKFTAPPTLRAPAPAAAPARTTSSPPRDEEQRQRQLGEDQVMGEPRDGVTPVEAEERGGAAVSAEENPPRPGPVVGLAFTPWPAEDIIRRGALATIQGMVGAGEDPAAVAAGSMEERAQSGREEEHVQGQEEASTFRPVDTDMIEKREPVPAREEKPAVFGGLDLYDPDED